MPEFEVDLELNENADQDLDNAINEGLENVGDFLTSYAKRIAPVDTGTFMRSIDWVKVDDKKIVFGSSDVPGKVWALEHGHSDQAPNGVFEVSARRNKDKIKMIVAKRIQMEMAGGP